MAQYTFLLPDVGEGIHEGQLVEWLASAGDTIKEDQPLVRIETDKAVVELPSPVSGKITQLKGEPGEIIHVGDPIAFFEIEGAAPAPSHHHDAPAAQAAPAAPAPQAAAPAAPAHTATLAATPAKRPQDVLATPHTRALARQMGVDITRLQGTGRAGRITDEDIQAAASGQIAAPAPQAAAPVHQQVADQAAQAHTARTPVAAAPPAAANVEVTVHGPVERVPQTFLRRKIAEQMVLSRQQLVHVTHIEEADVTELFKHYDESKKALAKRDIKLTPLPYFIKATIACLKEFPIFNASYDAQKGEILFKKYYNIGIAVDTPEGLVVPVIKDADRKDIVTIAQEIRDLAKRARERTLKIDEMRGGSYTITNIGPVGGVFATPIINYPELAILGLHKIEDRPAVVDGEICVRKRMYLSTSFDHQLIDGADAARFMRTLAEMLAEPAYLFTRF
ncbi:MAG: 2-oxo acid dehydrogenase subunit E2 [Myxococcales bacterium]|nr:2-oxo acid dehydrogenase subunit E2 [Myxococcales bacterium]MCB9641993.1 2-oxo acid dehydrogenase subunit E2 [Myxococcales bacterium]